ncbi:MAG: macro domain-containing protein [Actinomycetia bacterium]|nr:macro domain-containing protein [Actinomycetes bacterium]
MTVVLVGSPRMVRAWRRAFAGTPVTVLTGDILATARGGALVSPANSFGWMTGGLDEGIRRTYAVAGVDILTRVQAAICDQAAGELPVGQALVVPTPDGPFTHLVLAPTMRTPRPVPWSLNAYLAFRAALLAVRVWNAAEPEMPVRTLFCPGLATGIGRMPPRRAARQMRAAWDAVQTGPPTVLPSLARLAATEWALRWG